MIDNLVISVDVFNLQADIIFFSWIRQRIFFVTTDPQNDLYLTQKPTCLLSGVYVSLYT